MNTPSVRQPHASRFETIEIDLTQPGGWRLMTEPRRIIACVQACMGIPTDELERLPPWALLEKLRGNKA